MARSFSRAVNVDGVSFFHFFFPVIVIAQLGGCRTKMSGLRCPNTPLHCLYFSDISRSVFILENAAGRLKGKKNHGDDQFAM